MTQPIPRDVKYGTAYKAARRGWAGVIARGEGTCHEPKCLRDSRIITPGEPWDLAHDPTGLRIIGPAHRLCNRSEAATRGNTARANRFLRL